MEKMEVEKKADDVQEIVQIEKNAPEKEVSEKAKKAKWLIDAVKSEKKCDACGAIMHGWAYRQQFNYCPMCGASMVI